MRTLIVLAVVGCVAQLVDGSLGMGFGVTSTTLLLAGGIAPAAASAAVHLSEVGTTLAAGLAHQRMGNVDWRTVGLLAAPGGLGAFIGAHLLVGLDAAVARPLVAGILVLLGCYILVRFLRMGPGHRVRGGRLPSAFLVPLGLVGGSLDAFGGGGWGPVGTTSLLASGRLQPRTVIGSVSTAEFVVAAAGSLGFLLALGHAEVPWSYTGVLLAGGVVAAPVAALLVRHLPPAILGVAAGTLVLVTNAGTLAGAVGADGALRTAAVGTAAVVGLSAVGWAARRHRRVSRVDILSACGSPPSPTTPSVPSSSSPEPTVGR